MNNDRQNNNKDALRILQVHYWMHLRSSKNASGHVTVGNMVNHHDNNPQHTTHNPYQVNINISSPVTPRNNSTNGTAATMKTPDYAENLRRVRKNREPKNVTRQQLSLNI